MNLPKLAIAINEIDDDLISGAENYRPKTAHARTWVKMAAMAVCAGIVVIFGDCAFNSI